MRSISKNLKLQWTRFTRFRGAVSYLGETPVFRSRRVLGRTRLCHSGKVGKINLNIISIESFIKLVTT